MKDYKTKLKRLWRGEINPIQGLFVSSRILDMTLPSAHKHTESGETD